MDVYKTFLYEVRKLSFVDPFLKVHGDVTPTLSNYIKLLDNIKFEDGIYYKYYGDIKKIVNSFIICWGKTMDEAYRVADKYTNVISKAELLELMETTIDLNKKKQIDFGREFLPVKSQLEEEIYKEVEENFTSFMERLYNLRTEIGRLDKQDKVDAFAKTHFPISLKKKNEVFLFAHTYISVILTRPVTLDRIRVSLEEILLRAQNNIKCLHDHCTSSINSLLNKLYDKNKEHLNIYRQDTRSSIEIAEPSVERGSFLNTEKFWNILYDAGPLALVVNPFTIQRSMEIIRGKIEDSKHVPVSRLVEEYTYWKSRFVEFKQIFNAVKNLDKEENNMVEHEKIFQKIQCPINEGPKGQCWSETETTLQNNLQAIREMKSNAAKALMSFLSVRGPDRIIYTDSAGPYFVDEYGHKVYFFDFGLKTLHTNCEGQFVEADESEMYYYDAMGRFVLDTDGSKLYKIGACTSSYKLQNDVFEKQTKDCGHSQREVPGCKMAIKDPNDITFLPLVEDIDLSGILDPETSNYLWASFGHILPLALRDVAAARPRNPTHYLAHKLLFHKHSRSNSKLKAMKEEAERYRAKIFQDKKDQAAAASKAWRATQVKRRKPEESDAAAETFARDAHRAQQQFITDFNYFYE